MKYAIALLMGLAFFCAPALALAQCGTGQTPTYDDVSAVLFERHGCGGLRPHVPKDLSCSFYWVFAWKWLQNDAQNYSQLTLPEQKGTYHVELSLNDARELLRKYDFYSLNPEDQLITDIRQSVLTVKRCGVVTRVMMYPAGFGKDQATTQLFSAFDALVASSKKHQLSNDFKPFVYKLIFEGE